MPRLSKDIYLQGCNILSSLFFSKNKNRDHINLTNNLLERVFDECNHLYFDNKVEKPFRFEISTQRMKQVAWLRSAYPKKVVWVKGANGIRPQIYFHINNRYTWTTGNLKRVIIHEMIHLYLKDYLTPLTFRERKFPIFRKPHGNEFKKVMNELKEKYGLAMTINNSFIKNKLK